MINTPLHGVRFVVSVFCRNRKTACRIGNLGTWMCRIQPCIFSSVFSSNIAKKMILEKKYIDFRFIRVPMTCFRKQSQSTITYYRSNYFQYFYVENRGKCSRIVMNDKNVSAYSILKGFRLRRRKEWIYVLKASPDCRSCGCLVNY